MSKTAGVTTYVYETFAFMRIQSKFTICLVLGALLLLGAAPAYAAPPSWLLPGSTTSVGPNSANVAAGLVPNGPNTTCVVEYGETTNYFFHANCAGGPFSGTTPLVVQSGLNGVNGLNANTTYHFRFVARNADGSAATSDTTFTTPSGPPLIVSPMADWRTDSAASVSSLVKPNGSPLTSCFVQYGLTTAYGSRADCTQSQLDPAEIIADASLGSLTATTTYHFRMVAQNALGVTTSQDNQFRTCAVGDLPNDC